MVVSIIAIVLGVIVALTAIWLWRGTSDNARSWTLNEHSFIDDRAAFLLIPGLALLFLGVGLVGLLYGTLTGNARNIFTLVAMIIPAVGIILCFWSLLPVKVPRKLLPAWRRQQLDTQK